MSLLFTTSDRSSRSSSYPSPHGWLFLTPDRVWQYDPSILVTPHWARNGTHISPCTQEDHIDYPGNTLTIIQTMDMKTCLAACLMNLACQGVTLDRLTCYLKHKMVERLPPPPMVLTNNMLFQG